MEKTEKRKRDERDGYPRTPLKKMKVRKRRRRCARVLEGFRVREKWSKERGGNGMFWRVFIIKLPPALSLSHRSPPSSLLGFSLFPFLLLWKIHAESRGRDFYFVMVLTLKLYQDFLMCFFWALYPLMGLLGFKVSRKKWQQYHFYISINDFYHYM